MISNFGANKATSSPRMGGNCWSRTDSKFPWTGDILVPCCKIFASAELPHDLPVQVGKTGNWVAIGVGRWGIHLAVNVDGQFPDVPRHIPQADEAKARCLFSAADAAFLAKALPSLPCDDDYNRPVTLDLNGQVAVRQSRPIASGLRKSCSPARHSPARRSA